MRVLLVYLLLNYSGLGFNTETLATINGYGQFKFGTSPQEYKNLDIEIEEGNLKVFTVNDNSVHIDGVEILYTRVTFNRNKLAAVYITTGGKTGPKIYEYMVNQFGKPASVKGHQQWVGPKTEIIFEKIMFDKDAIVSFYSREMYDHKK